MVHRWDTWTGKALSSIHRQDTNAWPSVLASDGRTAAIVLNLGLLLSDVVDDEDLWSRTDGTPEGGSGYLLFSPDGGFLFTWSRDGYIGVWEIATRSVVARICLRLDGNLKLDKWPSPIRGEKGDIERVIPFDQPEIKTLAVSPDGRFLATS